MFSESDDSDLDEEYKKYKHVFEKWESIGRLTFLSVFVFDYFFVFLAFQFKLYKLMAKSVLQRTV